MELRPQPGPQEAFLSTPADIAIYGGSAGGGKSWALMLEPLRHIGNPEFGAVIFRRTCPQITNEGALWDESFKLYEPLGAVPRKGDLKWEFASGATIRFAHMQHEKNCHDWQGSQIPFIGFDELTHFTEKQFEYLAFSRGRSMCGVRPYVRATCNPDPDSFVRRLIAWWIDPKTGLAIPERSGVIRWLVRRGDSRLWFGERQKALEHLAERGDSETIPISVTFIRSSIYDNKKLMEADPAYLSRLNSLSSIERARLKDGNWNIRPAAGIFSKELLDKHRVAQYPHLTMITVGVDPEVSSGAESDETGIVVVGRDAQEPPHYYVLEDGSMAHAAPLAWGTQVVALYNKYRADDVTAEVNQGGDLVESNIKQVDKRVRVVKIHAMRGKRLRAEPSATLLEQGRLHMVGAHPELEQQMCNWDPSNNDASPDRMDGAVHGLNHLQEGEAPGRSPAPSDTPAGGWGAFSP